MSMKRLISASRAAGIAMAPSMDDVDGPVDVMPRPTDRLLGASTVSTAVVPWHPQAPRMDWLRELFGARHSGVRHA